MSTAVQEIQTEPRARTMLKLDIVESVKGFAALKEDWNRLADNFSGGNVFLTWEWQYTWWSHFGEGKQLHLIIVRDGEKAVAIAPMYEAHAGFWPVSTRVLQTLCYNAGDYGGLLVEDGYEDALWMLTEYLIEKKESLNAPVVLRRVPEDTPIAEMWRNVMASGNQKYQMDLVTTFQAPQVSLSEGMEIKFPKAELGRRNRKIHREHDVEFRFHTEGDVDDDLASLVKLHDIRWSDRMNEYKGVLVEEKKLAFTRDVVRLLDERGIVRLSSLWVDGQAAAGVLAFEYGDRFLYWRPAFDNQWRKFSVGHVLLNYLMQRCVERGIQVFDFLEGVADYKTLWADGMRNVATLSINNPGWRGSADTTRHRIWRRFRPNL